MPPIPPPRAFGFTSSTDVPLYWTAYGAARGRRLLLLHGGPGASHDYLLPQMLRLNGSTEPRDLLFYDQRGGGRSRVESASDAITWRTQVNDLARVAAELAAEPLVLVGYSWGGMLAMLYAIQSASDASLPPVARMALVDPAPVRRAWRADFEREFASRQAGAGVQRLRRELADSDLRARDPEVYRQRAFELSVAGYFADPSAAHDLTPFRVVGRVQESIWSSLGDYDITADLGRVRVPTLVVHGRQDPIPLESSQAAARALGAELRILEDCGHVPYVEQPDALFAALEQFLASP